VHYIGKLTYRRYHVNVPAVYHGGMTTFRRARSEEQREIRRQAILDTAADMLDEMPVSKVSLNELSRRVGLAKSPLLRYFESREAILLELLDRTWKLWLAQLPEQLAAGIDIDDTVQQRGAQLVDALTRSLDHQRTLCDLLSAQAGVLEHNVSPEVAIRYKHAAINNVATLAELIRGPLPELGDSAGQLAAQAILVIGAIWTHSVPSPSMLAAYELVPSLAEQRLDFTTTLRSMLTTLVVGNLGHPRSDASPSSTSGQRPTG
jgi:AcrR family transcriptional regulator